MSEDVVTALERAFRRLTDPERENLRWWRAKRARVLCGKNAGYYTKGGVG